MKRLFLPVSNRLAVLALGGAVALAGSALAFSQKSAVKLTPVSLTLDERPVPREEGGRTSFAPIVKRVGPGVVKVVTSIKPGVDESTSGGMVTQRNSPPFGLVHDTSGGK